MSLELKLQVMWIKLKPMLIVIVIILMTWYIMLLFVNNIIIVINGYKLNIIENDRVLLLIKWGSMGSHINQGSQ